MAVELTVDWTRCEARGVCLDLLPGLLRPDDWGYPIGRHPGRLLVKAAALPEANDAVRECPRMALRLEQA